MVWCSRLYLDCWTHQLRLTQFQKWTFTGPSLRSPVFFEAGNYLSSSLTDIAGVAWTGNVINHSTFQFFIADFKLGMVVLSFLKVIIGCTGAPHLFSCLMKLSVYYYYSSVFDNKTLPWLFLFRFLIQLLVLLFLLQNDFFQGRYNINMVVWWWQNWSHRYVRFVDFCCSVKSR